MQQDTKKERKRQTQLSAHTPSNLVFNPSPYVLILLLLITSITRAQNTVDYENIFSLQHNRVGIPKGNTLYIHSLQQKEWVKIDSIPIPEKYVALDGNIRRVYILLDEAMVFQGFYGENNDTLYFNDNIQTPSTKNWIRTPYSTEKDFWMYANGHEFGFINDGKEWHQIDMLDYLSTSIGDTSSTPMMNEEDLKSVKKLYSFRIILDDFVAAVRTGTVTFHSHEFGSDDTEAARTNFEQHHGTPYPIVGDMEFRFDKDAITAFIYDQTFIGVVYAEFIRFYSYDYGDKKWTQSSEHPDLKL